MIRRGQSIAAVSMFSFLFLGLSACATLESPELATLKQNYQKAYDDPAIRNHAPVTLYETESMITKAEAAAEDRDEAELKHYIYLGERKLQTAFAKARQKQAETRVLKLAEERKALLLEAAEAEVSALRSELEGYKSKETPRGTVLVLDELLFDKGKYTLNVGSQKKLDPIVKYLNDNPERNVSVEGHTDSDGSEAYNESLSLHRAEAVRGYLIKAGIAESRVTARGFGELYPVATNTTQAGKQVNRRVEIVIMKK